jgi:hypothetical protein
MYYGDTDSFIYEIKKADLYEFMKNNPNSFDKLRPAKDWEMLNFIKLTQHYKMH